MQVTGAQAELCHHFDAHLTRNTRRDEVWCVEEEESSNRGSMVLIQGLHF